MVLPMLYIAFTQRLNLFQKIFGATAPGQLASAIFLVVLMVLVYRYALAHIVRWSSDALDWRRQRGRELVFLELTPPPSSQKTALATTQMYIGLHGLLGDSVFADGRRCRRHTVSFEIAADHHGGIRYIAVLGPSDARVFKRLIHSYIPKVSIHEIEDYLPQGDINTRVVVRSFRQADHFSVPLASHDQLDEHDPIAYITGAFSHPAEGEVLSLQFILSPADRRRIGGLPHGKWGTARRTWWAYLALVPLELMHFMLIAPMALLAVIGDDRSSIASSRRESKDQSTPKLEDALNKLGQPLFAVDIRVLALGPHANERRRSLEGALHMFQTPSGQGLMARRTFLGKRADSYRLQSFGGRLPSVFSGGSNILSAGEMAALYHFPYSGLGLADGLVTTYSKTLAAPVSMRRHATNDSFDVLLGANKHHDSTIPIGLTAAERERHVYVIGGTGNGKTTLLQYGLVQDIQNGKGVAVIDPHGDLAESILRYIPKERVKDVIYFNPSDIAHPLGMNLLEQPEGLGRDELLLEQDFITESVVSIFRKIFSDDDIGGHRIEHFLRNTIHTAFTVPDATLFTVYKLLTNTKFRKSIVEALTDEDLIDFWRGEFNMAGNYQRVKMSAGVNAKLGRFQRSVVSRRILEQTRSTIDFDDVIQNKKILICNLSKGQVGEDTSAMLGMGVMAKLQLAALRRSRLGYAERTPFYLYVDEFQNFATTSFVQLLSEARKYKLFLTMAEQSTAQQEERRFIDIILANVGTVICFRSGSPVDEQLFLPLFSPYVQKGEIASLSAYNFYARMSGVRQKEPVSAETVLVSKEQANEKRANEVIRMSQRQYSSKLGENT
jgi:hypothetical protein